VLLLIEDSPAMSSECLRGRDLDRQVPQCLLITLRLTAICQIYRRQREYLRVDDDGLAVDDDTPVLECLLPEEVLGEVLDRLELLHRILPSRSKYIPHAAGVFSDGLGDTIDVAELGRDVALSAIDLHYEERLLRVCHLQVIVLQEVLSNADLLAI
jgi:hypothetical protein